MKTKILSLIILSLLFGGVVFAQDDSLPKPGLTPDSPFYFLERITEGIGTFFTFGDLKKAERHALLAAERLAEVQTIVEKESFDAAQDKNLKLVEKTLKRYERQLQNSMARVEKAQAKGENAEKVIEVLARVGQTTSKHLEVLAEVYEKIPEQAKPAIENAMKASAKGHEKVVEALKARNALGEVPEEAPLPTEVPAEVRERIQARVQQELEVEKVLEGLDPSTSLRTLCTEQGGPPEICEKLPAESFTSFKQIEAYCTELGGPSEICASVEAQCREYGVTTPGKCFLLMMTATVMTSSATELEASSTERDSDCPLGHITYGQTKYCCEDSDRSSPFSQRHYYMKGTTESRIINTSDGTLTSHEINTDSCDGDRLTEWMCDNRLETSFEKFDCPQGCEDGACKGLHEIMEEEMRKNEGIPSNPEEDVTDNLGGIGVEIGIRNSQLTILGLLEDSPAKKADLRTGDKILSINSQNIAGIAIEDAVTKISGKIGTNVVLTILRLTDEEEMSLVISVIRAYIAP